VAVVVDLSDWRFRCIVYKYNYTNNNKCIQSCKNTILRDCIIYCPSARLFDTFRVIIVVYAI
jgi:hypothetical protein